jgi:type 1 glutamine amidotransferase
VRLTRILSLLALIAVVSCTVVLENHARAQTPAPKIKRILIIGETKGFQHDSVSNAMGTLWKMGHDSGLWEAYLRTDCQLITKKKPDMNAKNLNYFDAIVFASTTGELSMDDSQKADMLSFIHDEGKGFVGIHAALDTFYKWPEYGEMIGGWFDQHPWGTFNAPIILEDPNFPATKQFPKSFVKKDEIYQSKSWSRDNVNVLLRLDENKLDYNNLRVHRTDHDFAVAWSKTYGKGRVFYSTLGHTNEAWDDPQIQQMYFEAVKWVLGMTEGSTASHPRTPVP